MVKKVISGGQTGADIAGLIAAKKLGLETGGTMPKGFRTLKGPRPEYADLYGVVEHPLPTYPPRTACNVRDSDCTMRFATYWESAGEKLTVKLCHQMKKPWYDVDPREEQDMDEIRAWLEHMRIEVLNVAGNAEETSPGMEEFVVGFLMELLGGQGQ